jgi:AmpD protein
LSPTPQPAQSMNIDAAGQASGAVWIASPNFDARPDGEAPSLLVIHGISLPPGEFGGDGIVRLFTNTLDHAVHPYYETLRGLGVSAHFLIRRGGELVQFVACLDRTWHAGQSCWQGRERCNDFSIGVELEGGDDQPYSDNQYRTLAALTLALQARYPIRAIVGHSEIAPGRKTDPGPAFDWPRFRASLGSGPI